jgi:hypothetical protein
MVVVRRRVLLAAVLVWVAVAVMATLLTTDRAYGLEAWIHNGAADCASCHTGAPLTDEVCTACHIRFESSPGKNCWSCHLPGADTSSLSSSSAACSQECHLYRQLDKDYTLPYTHGEQPHLGAAGFGKVCLDCHSTSVSIADRGDSPHHSGEDTPAPTCQACHDGVTASAQTTHDGVDCTSCHTGMNIPAVPTTCNRCHAATTFGSRDCRSCHAGAIHDPTPDVGSCTSCHAGYQRHAGVRGCTSCHKNTVKMHHDTANPTAKKCRSCHAKGHAGKAVANSKCATCHKGSAPSSKPRAQHSVKITKKRLCSPCHSKRSHASSVRSTTCRTCHKGKFHAKQSRPSVTVCLNCHWRARAHSGGYHCVSCHRRVVHDPTP